MREELRAFCARSLTRAFATSSRIGWAMGLTVSGWALFWATALGLITVIPLAASLIMFAGGLLLIPFSKARLPRSAAPRVTASVAPVPDTPSLG